MSKFGDDLLERVTCLAKKSGMTHKHGAIIIKNNEIVAEGINHMSPFFVHNYSIHAEIDALFKLKGKHKKFLEECTLLVVRIGPPSSDYAFKLSKPCKTCESAILKSGIKRVYYSCNCKHASE
jgi:deoxycytidylate deaminase